jgi:hypothetical protein
MPSVPPVLPTTRYCEVTEVPFFTRAFFFLRILSAEWNYEILCVNRLTDFRESEILYFCGGKDLYCPFCYDTVQFGTWLLKPE